MYKEDTQRPEALKVRWQLRERWSVSIEMRRGVPCAPLFGYTVAVISTSRMTPEGR